MKLREKERQRKLAGSVYVVGLAVAHGDPTRFYAMPHFSPPP
jgi:hypothetical protein